MISGLELIEGVGLDGVVDDTSGVCSDAAFCTLTLFNP